MPWPSLTLLAALCAPGLMPGSGQDQDLPPGSLDELLRQLREVTNTSPAVAPGLDGLGGLETAAPVGEPAIRVHRTRDPVQVAQGGGVHLLPYWSPEALLAPGDELRCGRSGHCVVEYPDGTELRIIGEAVLRPWTGPLASPRHLEVRHLATSIVATLGETPSRVDLPGGYTMVGADSRLYLHRQDGEHLVLENSGPASVFLSGALLPSELTEVAAGEKILLPVLPILAGSPFLPTQVARVGDGPTPGSGLLLEVTKEVQWSFTDPWLTLFTPGPDQVVARVAGARLVLSPGREWRLRRAPLGQARLQER